MGIRNVQPTCFFQRWVVVFVSIFSIQGGPLLVINGFITPICINGFRGLGNCFLFALLKGVAAPVMITRGGHLL